MKSSYLGAANASLRVVLLAAACPLIRAESATLIYTSPPGSIATKSLSAALPQLAWVHSYPTPSATPWQLPVDGG